MIAKRHPEYGHYTVRHDDGEWVCLLSFRTLQALVACRDGLARAVKKRRRGPWFMDEYMDAECDVFGIGRLTLYTLQSDGLIGRRTEDGPLSLTEHGDQVLNAILALDGVEILARAA